MDPLKRSSTLLQWLSSKDRREKELDQPEVVVVMGLELKSNISWINNYKLKSAVRLLIWPKLRPIWVNTATNLVNRMAKRICETHKTQSLNINDFGTRHTNSSPTENVIESVLANIKWCSSIRAEFRFSMGTNHRWHPIVRRYGVILENIQPDLLCSEVAEVMTGVGWICYDRIIGQLIFPSHQLVNFIEYTGTVNSWSSNKTWARTNLSHSCTEHHH